MTTFQKVFNFVIAGIVVGLLFFVVFGSSGRNLAGVYNQVTNFFNDGITVNSGDVVLNQAPWCVDFYATSTATRNKLVASSIATIEGVDGVVTLGYGSCQ